MIFSNFSSYIKIPSFSIIKIFPFEMVIAEGYVKSKVEIGFWMKRIKSNINELISLNVDFIYF